MNGRTNTRIVIWALTALFIAWAALVTWCYFAQFAHLRTAVERVIQW